VKTCPDCHGDGVIEEGTDDEQQCPRCGGSSFVPDDDDNKEVITLAAVFGMSLCQQPTFGRIDIVPDEMLKLRRVI